MIAIGGPPTPVAVPVKPDVTPAITNARGVGRNRTPVTEAATASSTEPDTRNASSRGPAHEATITPITTPGARPSNASPAPRRSMR